MPGAAVWAGVGLVLNALPLATAALLALLPYCTYYGMVESIGVPGFPPPSSRWQVPQSFVAGKSVTRRILVWGALLGPGFVTRNPFAGFAALGLAVAGLGSVPLGLSVAGAIGIAHATGRALAVFRDVRISTHADYLHAVLRSMRWRRIDGVALLVLASLVVVACVDRL